MRDVEAQIRASFPDADEIVSDPLREGVIRAWSTAVVDNDITDLDGLDWLPPEQARLGLPDETLVGHVRDVVSGSLALAESLRATRGDRIALSRDVLLAGALVHDVSKCYEYADGTETPIGRLLGHPHFGVHVTAAAGLPVPVQHIVLSHSHRTAVEPMTVEAEIVCRVDQAAAAAIRGRAADGS